jgi:hypothetical protein
MPEGHGYPLVSHNICSKEGRKPHYKLLEDITIKLQFKINMESIGPRESQDLAKPPLSIAKARCLLTIKLSLGVQLL